MLEGRALLISARQLIETKKYKTLAGIALLSLIITSLYSYTTRKKSIEAYITSDVVTIQSPMDGVITKSTLDGGSLFKTGQHLVSVSATRLDAQFLDKANNELTAIENRIHNSHQRIKSSILNLKRQLDASIKTNSIEVIKASEQEFLARKRSGMHVALEKQGAISLEKSLVAKAEHASQKAAKEKALIRRSILEKDRESLEKVEKILDTHLAYFERLVVNVNKLQTSETRHSQHTNRHKSIVVEEGSNNSIEAILSEYKFSENIYSLAGNLHNLLSEHMSLHKELESAKLRTQISKERSIFDYHPKFNGMLLMKAVSDGDEVSESQPLLTLVNCDRKRVEALFSTAKIKKATAGDVVKIKSTTSNQYTKGIIRSIAGEQPMAGTRSAGNVVFEKADIDRARVTIDLVEDKSRSLSNQSCQIGEKVIVEL